ncbi:hypothetical protein JTB14_033482 [Gonioctena quinquepunctata]|nr:hypothetical protein JTB14_033482 [Gonioctena quinquepunctata]
MIYKNDRLIEITYQFVINRNIKSVTNTCAIYFKHYRYLKKSDAIKVYAYCTHICKKCILTIKDVSVTDVITHTVEVYSSSLDFNHINKLGKQLRGVERKVIKNELLHLNPLDQLQNDVLALDESTVTISKNKGNVRCDAVYRKAKTEIVAKNDRDSKDIQDLILMRKDHPEYIKCFKEMAYLRKYRG